VSLLDINFAGFSLAKLQQQRISCLHVIMKRIYNFPKKSELPKFILAEKISWLIFSAVPRVEVKNLQRSVQAHFLVSGLHRLILHSLRAFVLPPEPARRLIQVRNFLPTLLVFHQEKTINRNQIWYVILTAISTIAFSWFAVLENPYLLPLFTNDDKHYTPKDFLTSN